MSDRRLRCCPRGALESLDEGWTSLRFYEAALLRLLSPNIQETISLVPLAYSRRREEFPVIYWIK